MALVRASSRRAIAAPSRVRWARITAASVVTRCWYSAVRRLAISVRTRTPKTARGTNTTTPNPTRMRVRNVIAGGRGACRPSRPAGEGGPGAPRRGGGRPATAPRYRSNSRAAAQAPPGRRRTPAAGPFGRPGVEVHGVAQALAPDVGEAVGVSGHEQHVRAVPVERNVDVPRSRGGVLEHGGVAGDHQVRPLVERVARAAGREGGD